MAGYMVGLGRIHDHERFAQYLEGVVPTVLAHGGEPLVVDDPAETLEGEASFPRLVVLRFPSKDAARAWHESPEYQEVAQHRLASSDHVLYVAEEFVMPEQAEEAAPEEE